MGSLIVVLIISVVVVSVFMCLLCRGDDNDVKCVETIVILVFMVIAALSIRGLAKYEKPAPEYEEVITTDTAPVIDTAFTTTNGITDTTYTIKIKKVL